MIDFQNTKIAFSAYSSKDLQKSYWLFKFMGYNWVVKLGKIVSQLSQKIYLPINWIIKPTVFAHFCGGESIPDCKERIQQLANNKVKTILDYSVEGVEEEATYDANVNEILASIDTAHSNPDIAFAVFKPSGFCNFEILEQKNSGLSLSKPEQKLFDVAYKRYHKMCSYAKEKNVRILIDAEESWIQNTIDDISLQLMQELNTTSCVVYNTIQCYRNDRLPFLEKCLQLSKENHISIGLKLVRGAYMEKERARAIDNNYPSPINNTKQITDKVFNQTVLFCLDNLAHFSICSGTHNEESNLLLSQEMEKRALLKNDPRIFFAQLLGMSDHISMNLSQKGYNVAKYVPYGPIKEVIPYLIRRAEENTSIKGQTSRELQLIKAEIQRRKKAMQA